MPSRLMVELIAAAVLLLLVVIFWIHHDRVMEAIGAHNVLEANRVGAERQKKADDAKLKEASDAHAKELAQLAAFGTGGASVDIVCHRAVPPSSVPAPGLPAGVSTATAVVQPDAGVHPDITSALRLFAARADKLSADARELNSATH